jgi:hypothetical protein
MIGAILTIWGEIAWMLVEMDAWLKGAVGARKREADGARRLCRLDQLCQLLASVEHAGLHGGGREGENLSHSSIDFS